MGVAKLNDSTLEQRARSGDVDAMIALGRQSEASGDMKRARGCFASAAKVGHIAALRMLAINLLTREPIAEAEGINMIRSAADQGDAEAMRFCAMLAAQDVDLPERWQVARECLERAAAQGSELALAELEFVGAKFDRVKDVTRARPSKTIFGAPKIQVIEKFVSPEICDWLIGRAKPHLSRARVYDRATGAGALEEARSNSTVEFGIARADIVVMLLRERVAKTAGVASTSLETTSVLHYAPGEAFEPHVDFLDPANPGYAGDIATHGQRVATFLIYLNDDFDGGETAFPKLDWSYKGRKGDALLFWNVNPSGVVEPKTEHAGVPPTRGEKWLVSQWIRQSAVGAENRP